MEVNAFEMDTRHFPFVYMEAHGKAELEDFEENFRVYEGLYERRRKFVVVADASEMEGVPDAATRKRIADWSQEVEDYSIRYHLGTVMVITSPVVRGALTAIHWLFKPPTPQVYKGTIGQAVDWGLAALYEEGIEVTEDVLRFAESLRSGHRVSAG